MPRTTDTTSSRERLIESLLEAARTKDRATLAKLRRGLGKEPGQPGVAERDGWVLARLRRNASRRELDHCCLIASLFALHPLHSDGCGMGKAFRRLLPKGGDAKGLERRKGPERRCVALLDSDEADLPGRLRQAVSLLRSNEIPLDWEQLLWDLCRWSHPDRLVQRRWARDFWGRSSDDDEPADA